MVSIIFSGSFCPKGHLSRGLLSGGLCPGGFNQEGLLSQIHQECNNRPKHGTVILLEKRNNLINVKRRHITTIIVSNCYLLEIKKKKKGKYHTVEQFYNLIEKQIIETCEIDTPNTYIHGRLFSWLGTETQFFVV